MKALYISIKECDISNIFVERANKWRIKRAKKEPDEERK
jgi:hypothetical protein